MGDKLRSNATNLLQFVNQCHIMSADTTVPLAGREMHRFSDVRIEPLTYTGAKLSLQHIVAGEFGNGAAKHQIGVIQAQMLFALAVRQHTEAMCPSVKRMTAV